MATVAVVFHSAGGTTRQLANSISSGVVSLGGVELLELEIVGSDIVEGRYQNQMALDSLDKVNAIIFGSPTYMGSVSAQFKAFADATGDKWGDKVWSDKIAAGFTIGTNLSGDQLMTLQYFQIFANQHGMLWSSLDIPGGHDLEGRNRLGAQSGLVAQSRDGVLDPLDLDTAAYLGRRVATLAKRYSKQSS